MNVTSDYVDPSSILKSVFPPYSPHSHILFVLSISALFHLHWLTNSSSLQTSMPTSIHF